ncbi:hypothetical protein CTRG_05383 [Candida tropicalis MYA-3404]|uniref:YTH domain-containing protein n=1 Tax=Candida tropicalis (strain ATCC MYA-3404 / T1) TaxID=294747 RepID=C5MH29_CANTT|nr:hypothetical protein CTRG_05383 [Candida tropicalis MYA-3404]EER30931.1 hypothetical protein CTRG_05383 [Candida tropicalis MYA-3404]KAG4404490.1 hypothetical protein JTP64_006243 [Candida tropicalis]
MFDISDTPIDFAIDSTQTFTLNEDNTTGRNDNDNSKINSESYYIPSLDDISTTSSSYGTATYSSHSQTQSIRYCTPRSINKVQSIESEIDDLPLIFKTNIWSNDYLTSFNKNANSFSNFRLTNTQNNTNNNAAGSMFPVSPSSEMGVYVPEKEPGYDCQLPSPIAVSSAPYILPVTSPGLITANPSPSTGSPPGPVIPTSLSVTAPANCLTFRTYTGAIFTVPRTSKFFVIKSYNILDVNASFVHNIWTSTELGNKRLDKAYNELVSTGNPNIDGKIFLFFSVNSSGKFCGIAEMKSAIDFTASSDIWCEQTRWKGIFSVEWLLIKDVPNKFFQHLKIPANEFKPVTNSRDTQEIPFEIGISMLKIISSFRSNE